MSAWGCLMQRVEPFAWDVLLQGAVSREGHLGSQAGALSGVSGVASGHCHVQLVAYRPAQMFECIRHCDEARIQNLYHFLL